MRRLTITIAFLLLIAAQLPAWPGKVVKAFKTPGNFPTGLVYDGQSLWLADYKSDQIYRIDPSDGTVRDSIPSPGFWPMGLAWDGEHLWNADNKQQKLFQIDPANGRILNVLGAPSSSPQGLAWDGSALWVSDNRSNEIMRIDMNDGTAVQTIKGPARRVNGLTFDERYLWCNDRYEDEMYMVDKESGEVIIIAETPAPYPRGMAWDGKHLWLVDYESDSLYQIVRQDNDLYRLTDERHAEVTLTHQVKTYGTGMLHRLETYLALPGNLRQQKIENISFSPAKFKKEQDQWRQPVAVFNYHDQPSEAVLESVMKVETNISNIRYYIFPDRCGTLDDIPKDIKQLYTANGSKYMLDDPFIQKTAKEIRGDEQNPYWIARRVFNYVRNQLEYKLEGGWNVAPVVLQRGTGSCSEYTISFIALARAVGLPARYVGAIVVRGDDASLDDVFHRWPEIYLPNYGWIPIDPQGGDDPLPRDRAMNIGNLPNRFLITTRGGGDSEYLGWYYNYNERYETEPQVKVNIETFAEWEPLK